MVTIEDIQKELHAIKILCAQKHPNIIDVIDHDRFKYLSYYVIDMEFRELTLADYIEGNREVVTNMINSTFIERNKMDMRTRR